MIGARRPFGAPVLAAKTMMRLIAGLTVVVTRREVAELLSPLRGNRIPCAGQISARTPECSFAPTPQRTLKLTSAVRKGSWRPTASRFSLLVSGVSRSPLSWSVGSPHASRFACQSLVELALCSSVSSCPPRTLRPLALGRRPTPRVSSFSGSTTGISHAQRIRVNATCLWRQPLAARCLSIANSFAGFVLTPLRGHAPKEKSMASTAIRT